MRLYIKKKLTFQEEQSHDRATISASSHLPNKPAQSSREWIGSRRQENMQESWVTWLCISTPIRVQMCFGFESPLGGSIWKHLETSGNIWKHVGSVKCSKAFRSFRSFRAQLSIFHKAPRSESSESNESNESKRKSSSDKSPKPCRQWTDVNRCEQVMEIHGTYGYLWNMNISHSGLPTFLGCCGFYTAFIRLLYGFWPLRPLGLFWLVGFCVFLAFVAFYFWLYMHAFPRGIDTWFQQVS